MRDVVQRLDEAHRMYRRLCGSNYERAAYAYLQAQVEQAKKAPADAGKGRP